MDTPRATPTTAADGVPVILPPPVGRARRAARIAAAVAAGLAAAALAGYPLDLALLRGDWRTGTAMAPITAVALLLGAGALAALAAESDHRPRGRRALALTASAAMLLLGVGGLVTVARRAPGAFVLPASPLAWPMAPNTAAAVALLALAVGALALGRGRRAPDEPAPSDDGAGGLLAALPATVPVTLPALLALSIGGLAVVGHLHGVSGLSGRPDFVLMAPNTALAIVALAVGALLAYPGGWFASLVVGDDPGAVLTRRLLPAAVVLPLLLGALRLQADRAGFLTAAERTATRSIVEVVVLVMGILLTARQLRRNERSRARWLAAERRAHAAAEEARARLDGVLASVSDAFVAVDGRRRFTYVNPRAAALLAPGAASGEALVGRELRAALPFDVSAPVRDALAVALATGRMVEAEAQVAPRGGWFHVRVYPSGDGATLYFQDVTARRRAERLAARQTDVLEMIAVGRPLAEVLHAVLALVEEEAPDVRASVLVADPEAGVLRHGAAPSLPAAFAAAVDRLPIAGGAGVCGTAAHRGAPVVVEEIAADPALAEFHALAAAHDVRSCLSTPVHAADGTLLGTVALYRAAPGRVSEEHERLIAFATHLVGIALDRERTDAARRADAADEHFLAELSGALQSTTDPARLGAVALAHVARHFDVPECGWATVDEDARTFTVVQEWRDGALVADGTTRPLVRWRDPLDAGGLRVVADLATDPSTRATYPETFGRLGRRAMLGFSLVREGRWVALLSLFDRVPRPWTARERRAFAAAAERVGAALATAQALHDADAERRRLEAVLDAIPVGVLIADASGRLTRASARVAAILGGPGEAAGVADYSRFVARWVDDGRPLAAEDWGLARALLHGETSGGERIVLDRLDGGSTVILNSAAPIRDAAGQVVGGVAAFADVTELHAATRALQRLTEELEARVEDRTRALVQANAQLALASERKSAFVAHMSHEMRTPLNAILGFCELLHDGIVGPVSAEQRECLVDVLTSGRHLLRLVDDVLDLARIEAGRLSFRPEPVPLAPFVADVVASLRPTVEAAGVALAVELPAGAPPLATDRGRLQQVLYNYLSNALKWTPAGGHVTLRVTHDAVDPPGWVRFTVADTGVGIAPEQLDRLFRDFEQLDPDGARGGTGLGLALTRQLVEAQGGRVGVTSAPGVGSTFWAAFPADAPAARAPHEAAGGV